MCIKQASKKFLNDRLMNIVVGMHAINLDPPNHVTGPVSFRNSKLPNPQLIAVECARLRCGIMNNFLFWPSKMKMSNESWGREFYLAVDVTIFGFRNPRK
jgi:hypothetical protein